MGGATTWTISSAARLAPIEAARIAAEALVVGTQIVNNAAILPMIVHNTPQTQRINTMPNQLIGMQALREMLLQQGSSDIRVPLWSNFLVWLVNGGISLPLGLEQQFFITNNEGTIL
jgi:hypothetical protein